MEYQKRQKCLIKAVFGGTKWGTMKKVQRLRKRKSSLREKRGHNVERGSFLSFYKRLNYVTRRNGTVR